VVVEAWAKTDRGKQRLTNEDCHYVDPDRELILVLDGMGGHKAGEVASRLAMETISIFYKDHSNETLEDLRIIEDFDSSYTFQANLLRQAAFTANRVVLEKSVENNAYVGMGCTLTGIALHGLTASAVNVGDSRIYLIRDDTIEQISKDHTLAEEQVERGIMSREEAKDSQLKHILSSVIGVDGRIRIHTDELAVSPGDVFLMCTDGLTAVMSDEEILAEVLESGPGPEALDRLVEEANNRGGPDNVTIAIAVIRDDQTGAGPANDSGSDEDL
jgi:PPM family protein phosphatase